MKTTLTISLRWRALILSIVAGLALAGLLMWGLRVAHAQATAMCFAEYTGDNVTDFSSADASAVRRALAAAGANSVVKVAGTCAGVTTEFGAPAVVVITQTLTLRGGYTSTNWTVSNPALNPTILDAQGSGRVIYAAVVASVEALTLTNGTVNGTVGAGLYGGSDLTLTRVALISNTAQSGSGGGAYISGAATISGSTFLRNTAQSGGGLVVAGAATLTNNTFFTNTAQENGGGLELYSGGRLTGNTFTGNSGRFGGGANIFGEARLSGNTFAGNTAQVTGGGAALNGPTSLENNTYRSNAAEYGGGLILYSTGVLTNNTFLTNTARENGGGLNLNSGGRLTGNTFTGNSGRFGGGVNIFGEARLTGNTFAGNTAQVTGGGAALNGPTSLENNTYRSNAAEYGGGLILYSTGVLTNNTFLSNTAQISGGGVWLGNAASLTSDSFRGNSAQFGGGATAVATATVTNVTFNGNSARGGGGGAVFQGAALIRNSQFVNNIADDGNGIGTGGGIQVDAASAQVTLQQTTFSGNGALGDADDGGGAIMVYAGSVTVTRSSLVNNRTLGRGGAVSVFSGDTGRVYFENSLLAGNRASLGGQAMSLRAEKPLALVHTTIASATLASGPAIEVVSGTLRLTNTIIASYTLGIENVGGAAAENYTLFSSVTTPYSGAISAGPNSITGTALFVAPGGATIIFSRAARGWTRV